MGTSATPKYAVDIFTREVNGQIRKDTICWDAKSYGRANKDNLEKFILAYGKSFETGGINHHITQASGVLLYPHRALLRYNRANSQSIAVWTTPAFMVW